MNLIVIIMKKLAEECKVQFIYLQENTVKYITFSSTLLPEKEDFYSHLNMEDITNADYTHGKRVCKNFK